MHQLNGTELKRLHRSWRRQKKFALAVILEDVQSPFNVGSIVRTSAAMGVDSLFLAGRTPDVQQPSVRKVSMGTDRFLSVERFADFGAAAAKARAAGFKVVALELTDEAVPLPQLPLDADVCLVVGHEDRGVSAEALAASDAVAFIPQLGKVGSLNVANALAVGCYEVRRQSFGSVDPDQ
jgi:tRNA (guanosine-2'-O-)-methyltransferase